MTDTTPLCGVHILDNPYAIDKSYTYRVPPALCGEVRVGSLVLVPFGRGNRKCPAVVCSLTENQPDTDGLCFDASGRDDSVTLKPVWSMIYEGELPFSLSEEQFSLCFFLKRNTLCTVGEAVRAILPPGALSTLRDYYRVPAGGISQENLKKRSLTELSVISAVRDAGVTSEATLVSSFGETVRAVAEQLVLDGCLERLSMGSAQKTKTTPVEYYLPVGADLPGTSATPDGGHSDTGGEGQNRPANARKLTEKQQALLTAVTLYTGEHPEGMPYPLLRAQYPDCLSRLRTLVSRGLLTRVNRLCRDVLTGAVSEIPPDAAGAPADRADKRDSLILSDEQQAALDVIVGLSRSQKPCCGLLFGVTGSGKTSVMMRAIDDTLDRGKDVIFLLPEIALTPQILSAFRTRYGESVAVIHSGLSQAERAAVYAAIRDGKKRVVVGTRSAVFAPVKNPGMIFMDEEQEHTYKSDTDPKYHTRDVAAFRCGLHNATLILSSATPSIESYYKAVTGKYTLITLKKRYGAAVLPEVSVVDMRNEPGQGQLSPLSELLMTRLKEAVESGNQAVLYLNRRGYSSQLVCRSCGRAVLCRNCSVALNYHTDRGTYEKGSLVCHWCGRREPVPTVCPNCKSPHLNRMGFGTQKLEQELGTLLPSARVMRMDADTTSTKDAYDRLLGDFRAHRADILEGTQMVAKGHDFPAVTLSGVLLADMSLYLDDYRAAERTFSTLTQVIGRAGRGDRPGLAVIQTANPDADVIKLAAKQDYETFYRREIRLRESLCFPPFCNIVLATVMSDDEKQARLGADKLLELVKTLGNGEFSDVRLVTFGPFEAPVYRVDRVFRMRMVFKCVLNRRARAMFSEIILSFPRKEHISIDFNPTGI